MILNKKIMFVIFFYSNYFNIHLALSKSLDNEPENDDDDDNDEHQQIKSNKKTLSRILNTKSTWM